MEGGSEMNIKEYIATLQDPELQELVEELRRCKEELHDLLGRRKREALKRAAATEDQKAGVRDLVSFYRDADIREYPSDSEEGKRIEQIRQLQDKLLELTK